MNFLGIKLAECGHFMIYLPVKVVLEAIARHSQGEDLGRRGLVLERVEEIYAMVQINSLKDRFGSEVVVFT